MYKIGYRDLVNYQKVSSWFSAEVIANLQVQRGSNKSKMLEKHSQQSERNGYSTTRSI